MAPTKKDSPEPLGLIEPDCVALSAPTALYPLATVGSPDGFQESLTSFVARLADLHSVTVSSLVRGAMASRLPHWRSDDCRHLERGSVAIDENGRTAESWRDCLETLTARTDLSNLTLLPLGKAIPEKNLIRSHRAWCAQCYRDQEERLGIVYDPLAWCLVSMTCCPSHRVLLRTQCSRCGDEIPHLASRYLPGFCTRCGRFLGDDTSQAVKPSFMDMECAKQALEMVGSMPDLLAPLTRPQLREETSRLVLSIEQREPGLLTRHYGIPRNTACMWSNRLATPTLPSLILLRVLEKSLPLLGEERVLKGRWRPHGGIDAVPAVSRRRRSVADDESVRHQMETWASGHSNLSMEAVSRLLNIPKRTLYRDFPEDAKGIARSRIRRMKQRHQFRIQGLRALATQATTELLRRRVYPSRRRVEDLAKPALLRCPEAKEAWLAVLSTESMPDAEPDVCDVDSSHRRT